MKIIVSFVILIIVIVTGFSFIGTIKDFACIIHTQVSKTGVISDCGNNGIVNIRYPGVKIKKNYNKYTTTINKSVLSKGIKLKVITLGEEWETFVRCGNIRFNPVFEKDYVDYYESKGRFIFTGDCINEVFKYNFEEKNCNLLIQYSYGESFQEWNIPIVG